MVVFLRWKHHLPLTQNDQQMNKIKLKTVKISLFVLATLFGLIANGQENTPGADIVKKVASKMDTARVQAGVGDSLAYGNADPIWLQKKLALDIYHMEHEMRAYQFQYYTSLIIFIMVLIIVALGLYLSYRQFTLTERLAEKAAKKKVIPGETEISKDPLFSTSSLELNKDGFKINTAVIGLMILIISLAFFFLYLNVVYKIEIQ